MWRNSALKLNYPPNFVPLVRLGGNAAALLRYTTRNNPKPHSWTMASRVKRVSIEGNIAVGKSTFARLLQSACPDWEVVPEPVAKWQNIQSGTSLTPDTGSECTVNNLLQMMYANPQRWSYTFQTHSCMSRMRTQLQPPNPRFLQTQGSTVQLYERSIYSDRYIFALNSFELGSINSTEWTIYQDWHTLLVQEFGNRVALEGIIYLQAPPQRGVQD
uniref:Deoxynucleoside kinase domain-containing protein n=1 Tax=Periophthalmus magnuspinnatus TaxID=409849 RepID=A0A3B4BB65_9GOBI